MRPGWPEPVHLRTVNQQKPPAGKGFLAGGCLLGPQLRLEGVWPSGLDFCKRE